MLLWQFMPVIVVYFICLVSVTQYLLRWQVMMYEDVSGWLCYLWRQDGNTGWYRRLTAKHGNKVVKWMTLFHIWEWFSTCSVGKCCNIFWNSAKTVPFHKCFNSVIIIIQCYIIWDTVVKASVFECPHQARKKSGHNEIQLAFISISGRCMIGQFVVSCSEIP